MTIQDELRKAMGYTETVNCGTCVNRSPNHSTCKLNPAMHVRISAASGTCDFHASLPDIITKTDDDDEHDEPITIGDGERHGFDNAKIAPLEGGAGPVQRFGRDQHRRD